MPFIRYPINALSFHFKLNEQAENSLPAFPLFTSGDFLFSKHTYN
jgi:hypothetical protein